MEVRLSFLNDRLCFSRPVISDIKNEAARKEVRDHIREKVNHENNLVMVHHNINLGVSFPLALSRTLTLNRSCLKKTGVFSRVHAGDEAVPGPKTGAYLSYARPDVSNIVTDLQTSYDQRRDTFVRDFHTLPS